MATRYEKLNETFLGIGELVRRMKPATEAVCVRIVVAIACLATLCCHSSTSVDAPAKQVRIGQDFESAHRILLESGATDVSDLSGLGIERPYVFKWYNLRDGTGTCILVYSGTEGDVIEKITVGDKGRGVGGKLHWWKQSLASVEILKIE